MSKCNLTKKHLNFHISISILRAYAFLWVLIPSLIISSCSKDDPITNQKENIVVINVMNKRVGLIVNELHGEFQTVIKSLGDVFRQMPWVSGGTILGNGEIALILDIPMLIKDINVIEHYEYITN